MRISSRTLADHVLVNLQRNYARLDRLQNHLSAGKRVLFPSDDPAAATLAMRLDSAVSDNAQYLSNARDGVGWLEASDAALQDIISTLHRAREIAVAAARSDLPDSARNAYADEMDQILRHVVQVANASHAGRFVFGGTRTDVAPYEMQVRADGYVGEVLSVGNDSAVEYEVGPLVRQPVNVTGSFAFGPDPPAPGASPELFQTLIDVRDWIRTGAVDQVSGAGLSRIDAAVDQVLQAVDRVGARQQGFELIAQRLQAQDVNLKSLLSKTEDLDIAQAIIELQTQENVYRLSLAAGARIMQPSLLDYLR